MSFPASVTTVTVTGRWRYADGSAGIPTGTVTFTPNVALQVPADGDLLPVRPLAVRLDAQGEISVTLMSTADPDVQPSGWAYIVNEFVGPGRDPYLAEFPAVAPGQTYDLSDIAPAVSDPLYSYVLLASVGTEGGPAGPLVGGLIPVDQIPAGGGGVTSVNGHSGVVVLAAANVGADASGAAAAAQAASQPLDSDLTAFAALAAAGFVVRAGAGAVSARSVVAGDTTIGVTNGDGVAGNASLIVNPANLTGIPQAGVTGLTAALAATQPLDADLTALAALAATGGMLARTGAGAFAVRTLTGSTETGVANGDGVAGNPTLTVTAVAPTASAVGDTVTNGGVATHRHAREGFAAPTGQNQGAGSAGAATTVVRSDHAHPYDLWSHLDHVSSGAWTMDPALLAGQTQTTPTAGTIYGAKLIVPSALAGVTSIWMHVISAGSVLTAGQCFCALFDGSKNLLQTSADQSGVWNSGGLKQTAITSAAVAAAAAYVVWFFNGTTGPRFHAGGNGVSAVNFGLSAANSRFFTADTGRTTTMPPTLGAFTASSNALWAAIS